MITPTVGRVVWYYGPGHREGDQPQLAIITYVWSDTCINIALWTAEGCPVIPPPTSIQLVQDDAEKPSYGGHYCTWMPYQREMAARGYKGA